MSKLKYVQSFTDLRKSALLKEELQENDRIYVIEDNKVYTYKNGRFAVESIDMKSNVNIPLYDLNKQLIAQLPEVTREESIKIFNDFYWAHMNNLYFMLLNNEKRYFTLFNRNDATGMSDFQITVYDIVHELGIIRALDVKDDRLEIWIEQDEEVSDYILFPYDDGVVQFYG